MWSQIAAAKIDLHFSPYQSNDRPTHAAVTPSLNSIQFVLGPMKKSPDMNVMSRAEVTAYGEQMHSEVNWTETDKEIAREVGGIMPDHFERDFMLCTQF